MSNSIAINNQSVLVKQYKGQRVLTFKDIDTVHRRADGTAGRNFRVNRVRFIEGEDYFKITPDEFRRTIAPMDKRQTNDVIVITESGYLMLTKSFTDDLSWAVQRQLVNSYFKYKETEERSKSDKVEEIMKKLRKLTPSQFANVSSMVDSMRESEKQEKQLSLYNYFDKKYKGEAVLSVADVEYFTKLDRHRIRKTIKCGVEFMDYYQLKGKALSEFKRENNMMSSTIHELFVITESGFKLICEAYGIKVETPKLFIEEKAPEVRAEPNKEGLSVKEREQIIDSIIDTLEELAGRNKKKQRKRAPLIESKSNYDVVMFIQR